MSDHYIHLEELSMVIIGPTKPNQILEKANELRRLQCEYDRITHEIVDLVSSIRDIIPSENDNRGLIEHIVSESNQVVERIEIELRTLIGINDALNMDTLYGSPRDPSLKS